MKPAYIDDKFLKDFISSALAEDIGAGDHSTLASIDADKPGRARLLIKDEGVVAGVELAVEIFRHFDKSLQVEVKLNDGARVSSGDIAFVVEGAAQSILTTERLVLNCMQRMSGIATVTKRMVDLVEGTSARLLDTRKTTPNFRMLEKWAVLIGGGLNHRIGLYDMIMLKDNHIDMAGGIKAAIIRTKDYLRALNLRLQIEVETRSLEEVQEVIEVGGVDVIMLDNMSLEDTADAVKLVGGRHKLEASGGITETTIRSVAETGVDFISVGALTHSVPSLDMSLKSF